MTEIVRASRDADFLALLPRIVGFRPTDSLVVVLFSGTRTGGAFRVDLPPDDAAAHRRLAEFVVSTARSMPGVDGVGLVVYTDESFSEAGAIPRWRLFADLDRRVGSRLRIVQLFCVAADGWGRYDEGRHQHPRSLRELELSPLAPEHVRELDRGDLAAASPIAMRAFDLAFARILETGDVPDAAAHYEHCLSARPDSRELAQLGLLVQSPATRDELMIRAAFGGLVGEITRERNERLAALQRERGLPMDDLVRDEIAAGRLAVDDEIDGLMIGRGRMRPDPDRIERARAVLRELVVLLDGVERSNPLCMLAWLSWALGHGTAAGRYLDLAREIDPRHGMTELLDTMTRSIPFPEWAAPQEDSPHT